MKKIAVVAALIAVLALGLSAQPASAHHLHHHHHHGGHFWGGFGAGVLLGTLTAPRYYAPAPVYTYPSPIVCREVYAEGFWRQVPVYGDGGAVISYRSEWIPPSTQRVCQ